jgi:hypothetical protein
MFGNKQYGVTIDNQACENIQVLNSNIIHCHMPDVSSGTIQIKVTHYDGASCIFETDHE